MASGPTRRRVRLTSAQGSVQLSSCGCAALRPPDGLGVALRSDIFVWPDASAAILPF